MKTKIILSTIFLFFLLGLKIPQNNQIESVFGYTNGTPSVSETGAFSYQIPITVSPGTAGMKPDLSIVYSSQGQNGIMGVGFALSGLSVISRSSTILDRDNFINGVDLTNDDYFTLDGEPLIPIFGSNGQSGTVYYTEQNTFSAVKSYRIGTAGGPYKFVVWTKSGLIMEYGGTDNSRIEAQGKTEVLNWALNKISDTKGNYIKFSYTENNIEGTFYVNKIEYCINDLYNPTAYASVNFEYENRPDTIVSYVYGSKIQIDKRLKSITTKYQTQQVRKYVFEYQQGGTKQSSQIISIREFGQDNLISFSPTTFLWKNFETESYNFDGVGSGIWTGNAKTFANNITGDFNGDGLTDIAGYSGANSIWYVNLSTGTGFLPNSSWTAHDGGKTNNLSGDFDGDGRTDLAKYVSGTNWKVCLSSGTNFNKTGSGIWNGTNTSAANCAVGDFNGDGRADIIRFISSTNWNVCLSTGTNFNVLTWTGPNASIANSLFGDFNTDGMTDIAIRLSGTSWEIYFSTGSNFNKITCQGPDATVANSRVIEFNGDGVPDIISYLTGSNWEIGIGTGKGFDGDSPYALFKNPENPENLLNGLNYSIYAVPGSSCFGAVPNFSNFAPVRNGIVSNFSIAPLYQETWPRDCFSFRYTGYIDIITTGKYIFYNSADNGSKLWIGEYEVLNNGIIFLKSGKHAISVGMFEAWGAESISVKFEGPNISKQQIPDSLLFHSTDNSFSYPDNSVNIENIYNGELVNNLSTSPSSCIFADVNGDGLTDICDYESSTNWNIYLNDGIRFNKHFFSGIQADVADCITGDFNGDGNFDIGYNSGNSGTVGTWKIANSGIKEVNYITSVTTGSGINYQVEYKNLRDPSVYTKGDTCSYPLMDFQGPLRVVSKFNSQNGKGGYNSVSYKYKEGIVHLRGRGFRGYTEFTTIDDVTGITNLIRYNRDFRHVGNQVEYQETRLANGTIISKTENTLNFNEQGAYAQAGNINFSYISKSINTTYELDGSLISAVTTRTRYYPDNDFGNLQYQVVDYGNGNKDSTFCWYDAEQANIIFAMPGTEKWFIGRLTKSEVTHFRNEQTPKNKIAEFEYNTTDGLLKKETVITQNTLLSTSKEYFRDNFGNIIESRITGFNGYENETRTKLTQFDTKGRFVILETNELGHSLQKVYEQVYGNVLSVIDANDLTLHYEHDVFGRLIKNIEPDQTYTISKFLYCQPGMVDGKALWYTKTQRSGFQPIITYFDSLDRKIRIEEIGYMGRKIFTDIEFSGKVFNLFNSIPTVFSFIPD